MTEDKNTRKKTAGRKKKKAPAQASAAENSAAKSAVGTASDALAEKVPDDTRFEDAFDELEQIVGSLEEGDQSLQDSLAQFERGIALARFCQKNLAEAEQKVMVLTDDMDSADALDGSDNQGLEPFDVPGNSDSE